MKKLALISSLAALLGSLGLGHVYFQRLEAEVSGGPKLAVLVAAEDVPVGAALDEKRLAVRDIPQAYVEARHVRADDVKKVLGARVASGLKANETLLWTDLARFNDHARALSGLVASSMRAVSIDGRSMDFEGLLRPGDRVDVLLTVGGSNEPTRSTRTLLQNLLVLSVGANIVRVNEEPESKSFGRGASVTLSANVEQAQLLTQAQERGRLTLTLRNPDDITIVDGLPETTTQHLDPTTDQSQARLGKASSSREVIEHVR